jgi:hypothetical protein
VERIFYWFFFHKLDAGYIKPPIPPVCKPFACVCSGKLMGRDSVRARQRPVLLGEER